MTTRKRSGELDLSGLISRLEEAKRLLEQAAALGAAQDRAKVEAMTALQTKKTDQEPRGAATRRRYR